MKRSRLIGLAASATVALAFVAFGPNMKTADAAIHEIVAAYCSGGDVGVIDENGFLEPAPIEDFAGTTPSAGRAAARPVIATGAVDLGTFQLTDHPANKFQEGTLVFGLSSSNVDHPSAEHCPGAASLP